MIERLMNGASSSMESVARTSAMIVTLAAVALLGAACGGGGGGAATASFPSGGLPPGPAPVIPPSGDGGGGGTTGGGGDTTGGGGDTTGGGGDTTGGGGGTTGGGGGGSIAAPPAPAPEPTFNVADVSALAYDEAGQVLYAIDAQPGMLWRMALGDTQPQPVVPTGALNVRAMAFDPANLLYLAIDSGGAADDQLASVQTDGSGLTVVGSITGHAGIEAMVHHGTKLYAVDTDSDELIEVDPLTAAPTVVGALAFGDVEGLASDFLQGMLMGVDRDQQVIVRIDPATGEATEQGAINEAGLEALAYVASTDRFYGASSGTGLIYDMDPKGNLYDMALMQALAYDVTTDKLYGSHVGTAMIVEIDKDSGWKRPIGYTAQPMIEGLAFDAATQTLYGVSSATSNLHRISHLDGSVLSTNKVFGWATLSGLTFSAGGLIASDRNTGDIVSINAASGLGVLLGTVPSNLSLDSLAAHPATGLLHAYGNSAQMRLVLDPANPSIPLETWVSTFPSLGGMAWDANGPTLFGTDATANALAIVVDETPSTLAHDDIRALVLDPFGQLAGADVGQQVFVQIDPNAQASTTVQAAGLDIEAMTHDGVFAYAIDAVGQTVLMVDHEFNAAPIGGVGVLGNSDIRAIASDGINLFAVESRVAPALPRLLTINLVTGAVDAAVVMADVGYDNLEAMAWDSLSQRLVAVDRVTRALVEIDPGSATVLEIGQVESNDMSSLVFDPAANELMGVDNDTHRVVRMRRINGATLP